MKSLEELRRIAKEAQREVDEAISLMNRIEQGEPSAIADLLHECDCRSNHIDMCDWYYESWDEPGYCRNMYLERARGLIKIAAFLKVESGDLAPIIKAIYGRLGDR